jgi:putative peptidoglycan lipid II flippase
MAMLCFTVFQSIDAYWAPQVGTGALASLGYSQRLLVALGNLIIAGPAAVILPRLATSYAEGRHEDLLNDTIRAVRMVLLFSVPVALGLSLLASPVVGLLFERGAFDQHATEGVAELLPFMMTGMIAMLCVVIIFRALFAKRDLVGASMLGALTTAGYFCLSGILSHWMGATGIAIAYALTWWLVLLLSLAFLSRGYTRMLFSKSNLVFIAKLASLSLATAGVLLIGALWIRGADAQGATLVFCLFTVTAVTASFYCVVALQIFKLGEVQLIYGFMASKIGSLTLRLGKTLAFKSK